MEVITPPNFYSTTNFTVFVGGTIDMDTAAKWQDPFMENFKDYEVTFFNPRRADYNPKWPQDPTFGTPFNRQVVWEIISQDKVDLIIYNLLPGSISPITLMEIGAFGALYPKKVIVCAPRTYDRYGNVKLFQQRFNFTLVESEEALVKETHRALRSANVPRK